MFGIALCVFYVLLFDCFLWPAGSSCRRARPDLIITVITTSITIIIIISSSSSIIHTGPSRTRKICRILVQQTPITTRQQQDIARRADCVRASGLGKRTGHHRKGRPRNTANLRTKILDFRGFDASITSILRGGIPRPIGNFPESLSQAILVGRILVGRLGLHGRPIHGLKVTKLRYPEAALSGLPLPAPADWPTICFVGGLLASFRILCPRAV